MGQNNAVIYDIDTLLQAGIDPRTGLPTKLMDQKCQLKEFIRRTLRVKDEQQAINRYRWFNLPEGMDGYLLERVLYYKGQGMFFYMKSVNKFFFLPYALDGEIDVYGRYTGVTPLPFNGISSASKDGKQKPWIIGLNRKPLYTIAVDKKDVDIEDNCVLLSDYNKQLSQTVIPRQQLNECLLDFEAEMIPFMRTTLQNETGVMGVRVTTQDEYQNVNSLNHQMNKAALSGERYLAVTGAVDFQELEQQPNAASTDYMQAMESVDNFRLSLLGINNEGSYQKGAYINDQQASLGMGSEGLVMQDGLSLRQTFCDIVNSVWGLGIWCEPSENLVGDIDMNGMILDDQDQTGIPGEQPAGE